MDLTAFFADPARGQDATIPQPMVVRGATRLDLPAYLASRGAKVGAEIGVYKGEFSERLCQGIPGLHLLCVDAWAAFLGADGQRLYKTGDENLRDAMARLAPYDCVYLRHWSPEAAVLVPNASLDFVYIDANHWYEYCVADIAAWLPKVKSGGVIAGHDYEERPNKHNQVALAVQGWTAAHGVAPWYVLGRVKVRPSEPYELHRTWLWVVP